MLKKIALIILAAFASLVIAAFVNADLCALLIILYMIALFIGLPVFFIVKLISAQQAKKQAKRRRRRTTASKAKVQPVKERRAESQQTPQEKPEIFWPDEMSGQKCAYRYEHVGVYVPDVSVLEEIEVGRIAFYIAETYNEHDPNAVAVYTESVRTGQSVKVGYLYRGRIQDMANEWEDRGDFTHCQISCVNKQAANLNKDGLKINMAFYK